MTKFKKRAKGTPLSGIPIPLLSATEAEILRQPKFGMYPFGWYEDGTTKNGKDMIKGSIQPHTTPQSIQRHLRRPTGGRILTNTEHERENIMSRASMTSNVTLFSRDLLDTRGSALETNPADSNSGTPWIMGKVVTPRTGQSSFREEKPLQQLGNTV